MIGKHKRIVCIMIMIMLLFSQGFPTFASQGTGSVTDVVVETDDGLVIVSIGAYAMALADGPGNETYDYMAGEGVPLVRAIGSGDKFINISEYAVVLADTGNVPDAIAAATALGREHTSTFKVLKAFDEDGKPILEPLFIDIIYASTVETDFDITVSFGTSEDELISLLRATVDVLGSNNERATVTINWTLEEGYDGYVEGTYLATGVLTLPEGWSGNPDNVKATVTVLPQEHLVLWLDAADYDASTGVWPDKSGFDNTVSQADEAKRPSRANPEELAGRPAVRFNGDNQYLDLQWNMDGGSFEANEITVFMVLKSYNMEDSQTVMGNYGEEGDVCFHISTRQNVLTAAVTHSDDQDVRLTFSDSLEPIIASYRVTATNHTAYVNGIEAATGSLNETINWGASSIGRNGGPLGSNIEEWHWEGYIAEIRIYNYAMDDWERNAVEQELERKWFSLYNPEPIAAVHFMPFPRLWAGSSNVAPGATVGIMSARGGIGSVNYSFVEGEGDTHNDCFTIVGNEVRVGDTALSQGIYSFRVRGQDDVAQTEYYFSIEILENLESSDVTILTNPYSEVDWKTFKQYKANFHTHTNQSDGSAGPAAVIEAYADAGYSILALADHDSYSYDPDTTWPWTKWISQGPELINYRSDEKHEDYETSALYTGLGSSGDKTILAVRGNELSNTHHTSSLFSEYGGPRSGEEYKAMQEIRDRGGLAILNHPGRENRADEWYADIYTQYQGTLIGMEVYNQGDRYSGDRKRWDRVNAMLMPDIVVWGYSNDDMHQIGSHTFRNYQFMLMEELSEEALRNALLTGASYFCYEPGRGLSGGEFAGDHQVPLIEEIVVNDTNEVTIIEIDVHDENTADTITWRTNKREIQGMGNAIDLNELDLDEDIFIRAELVNNYGRTYTQPFVLGYEPLEEIPVTGVGIVEEDQVLEVGETLQLTAVIAPANATEKGVSWSSANEDVASVSGSGLVTALSEGTALITVTTVDGGFTDYVTITVKGPDQPEPVEGLVLWLDASAVESLEHGETVET